MKVTATEKIKGYRAKALGVDVKTFRKLRNGEAVSIDKDIAEKYPQIFLPVAAKEVKNGD